MRSKKEALRLFAVLSSAGLVLTGASNPGWSVGASSMSTQFVGAKALGQGNAFVAEADDPSTVSFNPAGLIQLKDTQISAGGYFILPYSDRTGAGVPDDQMKRTVSAIPNFYLTGQAPMLPSGDRIAWGVGLTSPFGIATHWAPTSSVRYTTTDSNFNMVNVNPSIAFKATDDISLGAGIDYANLMNTTSKAQIDLDLANGFDGSPDGTSKLSGHGSGWGYNVGGLYKPSAHHAFGLAYRSQIRIPIKGSIELSNLSADTQTNFNFAGPTYEADATSDVILPASILAGYAFRPNDAWTFVADYEWTQWNSVDNQDVAISETDPNRLALLTGDPTSNVTRTPRHWRNVSAIGLGGNYKVNDAWQVRAGYAFFQKAVPNDTFSPDVPDAAVHLLTLGFSHAFTSQLSMDFAFNQWLYANRDVTNTVGNTAGGTVNGTYKTKAPAIALNLTYRLGQ